MYGIVPVKKWIDDYQAFLDACAEAGADPARALPGTACHCCCCSGVLPPNDSSWGGSTGFKGIADGW